MDLRRGIDITVAAAVTPFVLFAIAAVWVVKREQPLFRQQRIGLDGKPFTLIKFATGMKSGFFSTSHLTPIARLCRSIGADETSQIFCILRGEMSLIGPRPMPADEDAAGRMLLGAEKWDRRTSILPGLMPPSLIEEKLHRRGHENYASLSCQTEC